MYFQYGGLTDSSGNANVGSNGPYWSSAPNGSGNAYYLNINSSNVSPSSVSPRYKGLSVRCVANF